MKRIHVHTIEMVPEGTWLLSIGTQAPWRNRVQVRCPKRLGKALARLVR